MRRPMVGVAVHYLIGMASASWSGKAFALLAAFAAVCIWSCAGLTTAQVETAPKRRVQRLILYTLALVVGAAWYLWTDARNITQLSLTEGNHAEVDAHTQIAGMRIEGVIASLPELDGDRVAIVIAADAAGLDGGSLEPLQGERVQVNVRLETQQERRQAEAWRRGQRFEAAGTLARPLPATNFDAFDYREYLHRQRIHWVFTVKGASNIAIRTAERRTRYSAGAALDDLRSNLTQRMASAYPLHYSGFMQGLVLGVKDQLDPERYRQFSQLGLTHILAISGLHVAIYVGAILWLLRRLPLTREAQLAITMAAVPLYVVVTGASPSVVRSGIMAVVSLYLARRRALKDGLHVLSFAAILMLTWNPYYLHDVGFQLSFAVTAGLILGVPRLNAVLPIKRQALRTSVSVTVVAQAVSFPLTLYYFNGFSLLSFLANFILVPLFSFVVLPLGTLTLLASFLSPMLAKAAAWTGEQALFACFWIVERLGEGTFFYTIWKTPPLWWIGLYYALLFQLLHLLGGGPNVFERVRIPQTIVRTTAFALLAATLLYAYMPDALETDGRVEFLDVGQGDAILIRSPSGRNVLIDGGGTLKFAKEGEQWRERQKPYEVGRDLLVPLLKKRGIRRLDAVIISHQDTDHIGGLLAVLQDIPVKRIYFNGTLKLSGTAKKLFVTALAKRIPLIPAHAGQTIPFGDGTLIRMLYPFPPDTQQEIEIRQEQNETSLVFLLELCGKRFLFAGDIDSVTEHQILTSMRHQQQYEQADVIKISHHGSKSSSSHEWLDAWQAAAAVISVGRNNVYGHPHPSVTAKLAEEGLAVFRTDLSGEVQFRVTPRSIRVRTKIGAALHP
jgi:competence protein ComEC